MGKAHTDAPADRQQDREDDLNQPRRPRPDHGTGREEGNDAKRTLATERGPGTADQKDGKTKA